MAQLRHAQPGQSQIPAADYNAMVDATRAHFAGLSSEGGGPPVAKLPADTIYVRNDSLAAVGRFAVLGIDGLVNDPSNLEAFANQVVVRGVEPVAADHDGRFVVCIEPIAAGAIGRAKIDGVVQVQIDKQTEDDVTAGVADGDATQLKGGEAGMQILYAEPGTGTKWAVVRFGNPAGSSIGVYKFVSESLGVITAHAWDGETEGTDPVYIQLAKFAPHYEAGELIFAFPFADGFQQIWQPPPTAGSPSSRKQLQVVGNRTEFDFLRLA